MQYILAMNSAIFIESSILGDILGTFGAGGMTGKVIFTFGMNDGNSGSCGGLGKIGMVGRFKFLKNHISMSMP